VRCTNPLRGPRPGAPARVSAEVVVCQGRGCGRGNRPTRPRRREEIDGRGLAVAGGGDKGLLRRRRRRWMPVELPRGPRAAPMAASRPRSAGLRVGRSLPAIYDLCGPASPLSASDARKVPVDSRLSMETKRREKESLARPDGAYFPTRPTLPGGRRGQSWPGSPEWPALPSRRHVRPAPMRPGSGSGPERPSHMRQPALLDMPHTAARDSAVLPRKTAPKLLSWRLPAAFWDSLLSVSGSFWTPASLAPSVQASTGEQGDLESAPCQKT
jgi:hypothetical protein